MEKLQAAGGLPRWMLAASALGAAGLYQFLLLAPLALAFAVPALWFGSMFFVWGGLLGFLVMAWVVQPERARPPAELPREAAPALFALVDDIARRLDAPVPHAIALDDELNAGALELNRGLSLRRTRRVLVLGRPLLAVLDREALAAVVAHELAHFSRRHGRLGHWLYRTRAAWLDYARAAGGDDSSPWERAGLAFAQLFVPWFQRASFAQSRADEFEADALAAQACGGPALGRALQQLDAAGAAWPGLTARLRADWQRQHAQPPGDLIDRLGAALREAATTATVDASDRRHTTHPPTPARLQALGTAAGAVRWDAAPAGPALLGDRWTQEAAGPDAATAAARHAWASWHRLRQHTGEAAPQPRAPREALAAALAGHPVLRAAWCQEQEAPRRLCSLSLQAEPRAMEAEGVDEEALVDLGLGLLQALFEPAVALRARVVYTTEPVPEELAARPDTRLFGP